MRLIPTALKDKLPKGFSYPLGAEAICGALDGIPHFDNAKFWFHWRDEYWASRWRKRLEDRGNITLFQVGYAEYPGNFRVFRVYSVPSQYTVFAREHLLVELGRVRHKLLEAGCESRSFQIAVKFNLAAAERAIKETVQRTRASHFAQSEIRTPSAVGSRR